MIKRILFSLVSLLVSTNLYAVIDLTTVTGWSTVLQGPDLDHGNDQQAVASIDLLGDATYPMFYMEFDDQLDADPLNDEVAFSFRADSAVDAQGDFKGYLWIGLDFDNDGIIDNFMVLNGDGKGVHTLTIYNSDGSANNSPSTTSLDAGSGVAATSGFSFYHSTATDIADIDSDGDDDYIVSYKINLIGAGGLAAALNTTTLSGSGSALSTLNGGSGVDSDTPFKIVVSSAQQVNSLNGDLGGYDAADSDGATLYTTKGAFTPTITYSDTDPLDLAQTTITASPTSVVADGSTTSTITVQAKDSAALNLTNSAGTLVLSSTGSGTIGSITDNNDGSYTATITNTVAENVTISGTIDGGSITDTATVNFTPGAASVTTTTISVSSATVTADGSSSSTITVQVVDVNGNNLISGGDSIVLSTTGSAVISSVSDNGNGTYTATITNTVAEAITISGTIGGNAITDTEGVTFTPGAPSVADTTITANPVVVVANGSTSTISVQAIDANGNNITSGGDSIMLFTTSNAVISSVTDVGNGTYTATISNLFIEAVTITGSINMGAISDSAIVTFVVGAVSSADTTISVNNNSVTADGTATSTITVQAKDASGNNLTASGGAVVLSENGSATISAVTDNNDGTYTATITNTVAEAITISGTIGGNAITDTAAVTFTAGAASAADTTISVSSSSVTADGSSTSTITVQAKDSSGNNLTASGGAVVLSENGSAIISSVTDNNDGTYTATITNTVAEAITISGTIGGNAITDTAAVTFTTGAVSAADTTISVNTASVTADGSSTSTITVQTKDASGNNLTASGGAVTLTSTGSGSISSVTDNNDGTYTATITNTVAEAITISGTIGGNAITDTAGVTFTAGAASAADTTISVNNASVTADGVSTSTITVQTKDASGNNLTSSGGVVALSENGSANISAVTDNNDGTYTATITNTVAEAITISGTIGGNAITDTAAVTFTAGAASAADTTINISNATVDPDGTSTSTITVQAKDSNGNNLTSSGGAVALTENGSAIISAVIDNNDGTYTATITNTVAEAITISGTIGGNVITDTALVTFVDTAKPVITLTGASPITIERGLGYLDSGATATDNVDGNITADIVTVNPVDANKIGTYTVTYDVGDAAGNAAIQVTRTVIVEDTIAPGVSIINQPASVNTLNSFNVTFQFTEVVSGFAIGDISVINATVSNFVNVGGVGDIYTADINPTGAGDVTVGVNSNVAQDASSNSNTAAVTMITTFDNAPPVIAITGAPDVNLSNQSAVIISGACEVGDGDVSVFLTIGALPMFMTTACVPGDTWSTSFDLSTVTDGTNHIDIGAQQTDGAGNIGSASFVMISKDTVRPNVLIQNVPGFVNANEFIVTFAFDEAVTGFDSSDISVTNGVVNVASFNAVDAQTYTVGISADGVGDVTLDVSSAVAQDLFGNANNAATPAVAVFDITAPVVSITAPVTVNAANDDSYMVAGNCDTGDGDATVSIVGAIPSTQDVTCTAGNWTAAFDVSAIADGSNALSVDASQTDVAGNTGNANAQVDKDVLIGVPTVNLLVTNSATPVISGTADAGTLNEIVIAGATYTVTATTGDVWSLDTAVATPDSGTFSLLDGSNEVVVTSTDSAGNSDVDISSNEVTLTIDDDNDGIPNSVECPSGPPFDNSCRDTDGDGTPDFQEVDSDNDGIPDASEAGLDGNNPIDSDGDGTPDYRDTDSDNDGIDDSLEGVVDTDGDGIPDYLDIGSGNDSDGDGIPDNVECPVFPTDCPDTDGDSSPDYLETDSDNDGIDDAIEAGVDPEVPIDTDGDGTPDYRDTDSDADGTDDATEGLIDNDNDGIPDYVDVITTGPGAGDSDGDGISDNLECVLYPLCADSDSDSTPDYMETDSDNDGIPDAIETGTALNDADSDGIDDALDVGFTGGLDLDNDGVDDRLPLDTDGDGTADYKDGDSDGDGIDDVVEGLIDTDADGIPDYLDPANGDASGTDITGSGDSDGDGLSDADECFAGLPCPDVDADGLPDYMDPIVTDGPLADYDNDGLANHLDPDDDNDNIPDVVEDPNFDVDNDPASNPLDSDLDGTPDYLDEDSDGDGLSDFAESGASGNDSDGDNIDDSYDIDITGGNDLNNDGVDDSVLPRDSDADNLPDYLDTVFDGDRSGVDTDKDGIPDDTECPVFPTDCPDSDNDGTPDFLETDSDGDGLDDGDEKGSLSSGVLLDTDGDGLPDYQDTDSDGDGIPDAAEGLSADTDGDGIPDVLDADSSGAVFGGDSDGDGIVDMDECISYPDCKDSNNDGTPDYMDADVNPYDSSAKINTGLNGVGSNGPWSLLFIITAFVLRRKVVKRN